MRRNTACLPFYKGPRAAEAQLHDLMNDKRLHASARLLAWHLAFYIDRTGDRAPSQTLMSEMTGISVYTINKRLAELVEMRWLRKRYRGLGVPSMLYFVWDGRPQAYRTQPIVEVSRV